MPNSETDERSLILVCNCFKINPKTQPVLPIVGFIKNRKRAGVWDRKLVYIEPSQKSRRERRGQEKLKETDPIWIFRGFCQLEPRVSWLVFVIYWSRFDKTTFNLFCILSCVLERE